MFELGAANQGAEVIPYQNYIVAIISVRVKTLTILLWQNAFTPRLSLSVL
jgi:hypothetical protein